MRFGSKLKLVCSLYQLAIYSVSSVLSVVNFPSIFAPLACSSRILFFFYAF